MEHASVAVENGPTRFFFWVMRTNPWEFSGDDGTCRICGSSKMLRRVTDRIFNILEVEWHSPRGVESKRHAFEAVTNDMTDLLSIRESEVNQMRRLLTRSLFQG